MNLARNQISSLPAKLFHMLTKLRILDVSENPLEDLEPDVFKDITVSNSVNVLHDMFLSNEDVQQFFTGFGNVEVPWLPTSTHKSASLQFTEALYVT